MRLDTPEFEVKNKSKHKEPIFVVELSFDEANTDVHYLTSKPVTGLTGNIINDTLKIVSSTSQKLNPDKANSTIGSIKFECFDTGLTSLQQTKLSEGKGLKGKRVRVHKGYKGLTWDKFVLIQTQIIDKDIAYKDGVYTFSCADVQRQLRDKIFIPKETTLTASISATASTIPVFDTSAFETVYQVPSASGKTLLRGMQQSGDHPGLNGLDHIGVIKIENDEGFELALWTGKTADSFTNVHRGVLGTKPLAVDVNPGSTNQNAPKITEYVYLEMPAVKLAYAILTGSLYGHAGEFLPDHWNLGVSTDYVKTSAFVNIGSDLWDTTDDDDGYPATIRGYEDIDGKKFLEQDIFYMLGLYAPILSTGELSLKRLTYVGATGSYDRLLNEDNIVKYGNLRQNLSAVENSFILKWNWDETREKYTRTSVFIDPDSISKHGESEPKVVKLKTLHGSRHSDSLIRQHFDGIRNRYAGPPLEISLTLTPDQNDLEVGDIVRLQISNVKDATAEANTDIDRNFEIQSIQNDWQKGRVQVQLFASSQRASDIAPDNTENPNLAFLTAIGTEINATNFPGAVSSSGGVTTITGTINLTGHATLTDSNAIYYCSEDLTNDASGEIIINDNVQIRVNGFFTNNGQITGKGNGLPGGVADYVSENMSSPIAANLGKAGIGKTIAQGGLLRRTYTNQGERYYYQSSTDGYFGVYSDTFTPRIIHGSPLITNKPILSLDGNGNVLGLPSDLRGSSGSSGAGIAIWNSAQQIPGTVLAKGGNGGNGGAGLVIFSLGSQFGVNANIDLSGDNGLPGETEIQTSVELAAAGAGAGGHPGGFLLVTLDSSQTFPTFTSSNITQNIGVCPETEMDKYVAVWTETGNTHSPKWDYGAENHLPISSNDGGGGSGKQLENTWDSNSHIIFLDTRSTPEVDEPPYVRTTPSFSLTEYTNTPVTPEGNKSTIEVSVTPPSDSNYAYSHVYYREQGTEIWFGQLPASNEVLIEVPSDGKTYEIWVDAVSTRGLHAGTGSIQTITVTDKNGRTDAELAVIYPFDAITGLGLDQPGSTFTGIDAVFHWDHDNGEKTYFNYYEIQMYNGATLLRTEKSVSPFYEYSYDKNASDFKRLNASTGVYWNVEIRVKAVSKYYNNLSNLYVGSQVTFSASATTTNDPANLRYYTDPASLEQSIQDAGDTANWSNVNDDDGNRPADNADVTADNPQSMSWVTDAGALAVLNSVDFNTQVDNAPVLHIGNNSYDGSEDASQYSASHKTATLVMEFTGTTHFWPTNYGGVVTYWFASDRAKQVVYDAGGGNNEEWIRFVNPSAYPTWSAWKRQEVYSSSDVDALQTLNGPAQAGADVTDYDDDRVNNNNATPYTLNNFDNKVTFNGAMIEKLSSGSSWDGGVYSSEGFTGGVFLSFKAPILKHGMYGFSANPSANASYTDLEFAFYLLNTGALQVRRLGTNIQTLANYAAGDTFTITYDGTKARFFRNGALVFTYLATVTSALFFDSSMRDVGAKIESIQFGPYSSGDWESLDNLPDRFSDNVTTGLNVTQTHMGYHNGVDWTAYINDQGEFYFGDGGDKFISFDLTDIVLGKETRLLNVDTYNSNGAVYHNYVYTPNEEYVYSSARYYTSANGSTWIDASNTAYGHTYVQKFGGDGLRFLDVLDFTKDINTKTKVRVNAKTITTQIVFAVGHPTTLYSSQPDPSFGFHFKTDGYIWIFTSTGSGGTTSQYNTNVTWTTGVDYELEMNFLSGNKVEYYINGNFEAVRSGTSVPSSGTVEYDFGFYILNANGYASLYFNQVKQVFHD